MHSLHTLKHQLFTKSRDGSWNSPARYSMVMNNDDQESCPSEALVPESDSRPKTSKIGRLLLSKAGMILQASILMYLMVSTASVSTLALNIAFTPPAKPRGSPLDAVHASGTTSEPPSTRAAIQVKPCGNSTAEAEAAGCHFDIISFSWLPPRCYDAELADEFRNYTRWGYWLDAGKTRPVPPEVAWRGEFEGLFTEFEHHLVHCTFLWRKMHRALLGPGKEAIDSVTGRIAHTEHCAKMLLTRREVSLDVVNAMILVKFPDCGIQ